MPGQIFVCLRVSGRNIINLLVSRVLCRWFCHFDDDNYVNVPRLVSLLNEYSPSMEWYLGKPSVASPLEIHLDYVSI